MRERAKRQRERARECLRETGSIRLVLLLLCILLLALLFVRQYMYIRICMYEYISKYVYICMERERVCVCERERECLSETGSKRPVLLLLGIFPLALLLVRKKREVIAPLIPAALLDPCGGAKGSAIYIHLDRYR